MEEKPIRVCRGELSARKNYPTGCWHRLRSAADKATVSLLYVKIYELILAI